MKLIFWFSIAGMLYTYAAYPVLIWACVRLRPRPWKTRTISPSVSVVMAVHNGAALLREQIEHLVSLDYPNIREVIVVSDGSTDGTAEILDSIDHPLVKIMVNKEHLGKAVAVNAGAAEVTGELILFVDIRPRIAAGAIQHLVNNFADPNVGCANGELVLSDPKQGGTAGAFGGVYWRYENWIRTCEAAFDSPVGVYGGFYAVRRNLVEPQPPGMILDDMFQPLSIIRKGYRVVLDPKSQVHDTWQWSTGKEFERKVRTLAGNFQLLQLAPWTLSLRNRVLVQFFSHKVMRLIVPYLAVLLLASSFVLSRGSKLYAAAAIFGTLSLVTSIVALRYRIPLVNKPATAASAALVMNAAAVVALYRFLFTRGPLWKIWKSTHNPAEMPVAEADGFTSSNPQNDAVVVR